VESGALGVLLALSQLPHFVETRRICAALACQCVTLCPGFRHGKAWEKFSENPEKFGEIWENLAKFGEKLETMTT